MAVLVSIILLFQLPRKNEHMTPLGSPTSRVEFVSAQKPSLTYQQIFQVSNSSTEYKMKMEQHPNFM